MTIIIYVRNSIATRQYIHTHELNKSYNADLLENIKTSASIQCPNKKGATRFFTITFTNVCGSS